MSSLQGSLGVAFLQEHPGPVTDAMHHQEPRGFVDNQLVCIAIRRDFQGKWSGVQDVRSGGQRHAIYKLAADKGAESRTAPGTSAERWLRQLERHYIVEGKGGLIALFQDQPGVAGLLLEAVPQLRRCFGDRLLQLQMSANEEEITARASVVWPGDLEEVEAALGAFDRNWWLANCAKSNGYLVFDFELVDAI